MKKIITIGRECGSGGHTIAIKVAEVLGIPCYDKEIISMVADKCMVSKEYAEKVGELLNGTLFHSYYGYGDMRFPYSSPSLQDQINSTQVEIINNLAENSSCVIVGRGADYVLRNRNDVLNIFIKASMDYKVMISKDKHDLTNKEAKTILSKRDKERSKHYYFYTGQTWGDAKNYHLVLDSGVLGEDTCVKLIVEAFKNS